MKGLYRSCWCTMPAKSVKKVSKVGEGFVVFITGEAKALGWTNKDYVSVEIDEKEKRLILKRIEI